MQTDHIQPAVTVPMSKPSAKPKNRKAVPAKPSDYNEVLTSVVELLDAARRASARVVNSLMTATYWEIGRRIVEHEQAGSKRAGYGEALLEGLSRDLTRRFGRGFGIIQLRTMRQFYATHALTDKIQSEIGESPIRQSLIDESAKSQEPGDCPNSPISD
jgi:hypothetical protein